MNSSEPSLLQLFNPGPIVTNLWRRRELTWQFAQREIEARHRGSRLGPLWTLVNPLSMLVLYWFLFGVIFQSHFNVLPNESESDVVIAMFFGLTMFHVFSETLAWGPAVITSNPNFVKKVVFPLEILPFAKVGDTAYHLFISLALVLIGSALFGTVGLSWSVFWLPVLVLPLLVLALGLAWTLAAIGAFLRDIAQLTAFISTAVMFASAVMFSPQKIQQIPALWIVLRFNPLLQILDLGRRVVLWHEPMAWVKLGYVYGSALVALVVGNALFSLLRKSFAEVI